MEVAGGPSLTLQAAYQAYLDQVRGRAGALTFAAFAKLRDKEPTDAQWAELLLALYAAWVGTQLQAVTALDNMTAGTLLAYGVNPGPVSLVTQQYAGLVRSGSPVFDVLGATRRAVQGRVAGGATWAESISASYTYLSGVISSDPHRVARDGAFGLVEVGDPRITAWVRVAEPGACKFCRMLATRGAVYSSESAAGYVAENQPLRYHLHCKCTVMGVTNEVSRQRTIKAGRAEWARMVESGDVPTRRKATGRSAKAFEEQVAADSRERAQRLQMQQLRGSIPTLEARVAAGDESAGAALAWQRGRLAQLEQQFAATAAA